MKSQTVGGRGKGGGFALAAAVDNGGRLVTKGALSHGIAAQSIGGGGGSGGFVVAGTMSLGADAETNAIGGSAGAGANAGSATVDNRGEIFTAGQGAIGILAQAVGGGGGTGGFAGGFTLSLDGKAKNNVGGGAGGKGGIGGTVLVKNPSGPISTLGDNAIGILAQSIGGGGGNGGMALSASVAVKGDSLGNAIGGKGDGGGVALGVTVENGADISTLGNLAHGIEAQSIGGGGGNGGLAIDATVSIEAKSTSNSIGGTAGGGGNAGAVVLSNFGNVTIGSAAQRRLGTMGLIAQSIGGGGGNGGFAAGGSFSLEADAASTSIGGSGSAGGNASGVNLTNGGRVLTFGEGGTAVLAQSIGGGGGNGGFSIGAGVSIEGKSANSSTGGTGAGGGTGGDVLVTLAAGSDIQTDGAFARGVQAQSIGGGGGNGGFAVGAGFSLENDAQTSVGGGAGGTASGAGTVEVNNLGLVSTLGLRADGILAQSIGGGGGSGGFAIGANASIDGKSVNKVGAGNGGGGGSASAVTVTNAGAIVTGGPSANGITAQAVGGGGGNGGFAIGAAFSLEKEAGNTVGGGAGGAASNGGAVIVRNSGGIFTGQAAALGILAQSVGGGGGNGGFGIGAAASINDKADNSVGGAAGGAGGNGRAVTVENTGTVMTNAASATAISAQSIGGGGGNGAFSIGAAFSLEKDAKNSVGGNGGAAGGSGGSAGRVEVSNTGVIDTNGLSANGVLAQSIGGGGGSGGFAIGAAASINGKAENALGAGAGSSGGGADEVLVDNGGQIFLRKASSAGIIAQSIGGGGGNGGFAVAAGFSDGDAASNSVGGSGGGGGGSALVTVRNSGEIIAFQDMSSAIIAQSIGGGGGNGGFAIGGAMSLSGDTVSTVGGGAGGAGGAGGQVLVENTKRIETQGLGSIAVIAQSIGGGGGNGGFAGGLGLNGGGKASNAVGGGSGGAGNIGNVVTVSNSGDIITARANSIGVLAQSIGGGGGSGGMTFGAGASTGTGVTNTVGGSGGGGGTGGAVIVNNSGFISTLESMSAAIVAQSIGGGGGNGGIVLSGALSGSGGAANDVGGAGGDGGNGGTVDVDHSGRIEVLGAGSAGIIAQSIGGGGGNGGFSGGLALSSGGASSRVGATGGKGGDGGDVTVNVKGVILTTQDNSVSVIAQSIGGGGGTGGFNLGFGASDADSFSLDVGSSGNGVSGDRGRVVVNVTDGALQTSGALAHGLLAQAVGAGGGNNGAATRDKLTLRGGDLAMSAGAIDNAAGRAQTLEATSRNTVLTQGAGALGIAAQSIGGGGGTNGFAGNLELASTSSIRMTAGASTTGAAAAGADALDGNSVELMAMARIDTLGDSAAGVAAQSIGGGGGVLSMTAQSVGGEAAGIDIQLGGTAKKRAAGAMVTVETQDTVTTAGDLAHAVAVQSIGGGGGLASLSTQSGIVVGASGIALRAGGQAGGLGGDGGTVDYASRGPLIQTEGAASVGIVAQSIGGGGGVAGYGGGGLGQRVSEARLGGATDGSGGAVFLNNFSSLNILGEATFGLLAQSIGAGGGALLLDGVSADDSALTFGAAGASGAGGAVNVTNSGAAQTQSAGAHALVAQSIGGGGGVFMATDAAGEVLGNLANRSAGGSGGGGSVDLINNFDILTGGDGASGIIAQSIGGGGGLAGAGLFSLDGLGAGPFAGSAGGAGDAGAVALTSIGAVRSIGRDAIAVVGQSDAGTGRGGDVGIDLSANIIGDNENSIAIAAQSGGDAGAGNIGITTRAFVLGGSGSGKAIALSEGADNLVQNSGDVIARSLLAMTGTTGNDAVANTGRVIGNVRLNSGVNSFDNQAGSLFLTLSDVFLTDASAPGAGNTLSNSGLLNVGDNARLQDTSLLGNLAQAADGLTTIDVDLNSQSTDRVIGTGTASVDGTAQLLLLSIDKKFDEYTIMSGALGAVDNGLTPTLRAPAVGMAPRIRIDGGTDVVLYTDNPLFAELATRPGSGVGDPNVASLGGGLDGLEDFLSVDDPMNRLINLLRFQPDEQSLGLALTSLTPSEKTHGLAAVSAMTTALLDASMNCPIDALRDDKAGNCFWSRAGATNSNPRLNPSLPQISDLSSGLQFGSRHVLNENWAIGTGFGINEISTLMVPLGQPASTLHSVVGQAGGSISYSEGPFEGYLGFGLSSGAFDAERTVLINGFEQDYTVFEGIGTEALVFGDRTIVFDGISGVARSSGQATSFDTRLQLGYTLGQDNSWVRPYTNFDLELLHMNGHRDSGAGLADLEYLPTNQLIFSVTPGLEVGVSGRLGEHTTMNLFGRAGLQINANESIYIDARFANAPGSPPFRIKEGIDPFIGRFDAAVELEFDNGVAINGSYHGAVGKTANSHSFWGGLEVKF